MIAFLHRYIIALRNRKFTDMLIINSYIGVSASGVVKMGRGGY